MNWREVCARLESEFDSSRISPRVLRRIDDAETLYLACSGGADSVLALLVVYSRLVELDRLDRLAVLHFNHGLRGAASDGDASFVQSLCSDLDVHCVDGRAEESDTGKITNEESAREARFAFFREATGASEAGPVCIVSGHHADDVVESMLIRLSRGAGLQGLSAPRELSKAGGGLEFVRPLLDFGRAEIHDVLRTVGGLWREDESNQSDANYRARLRKGAIPSWEDAADRPIRRGVGLSRRLLAEDAEALEYCAEQAWSLACQGERRLSRASVSGLPTALQRRLLDRLAGKDFLSAQTMDLALKALEGQEALKIQISAGSLLTLGDDDISVANNCPVENDSNWAPFYLPIGTRAFLPDGSKLSCDKVFAVKELLGSFELGSNQDAEKVYLSSLGNSSERLYVRRKLPGDAFKPRGKSSPKKLKNLFIDRKIAAESRGKLPVFECETGGIVWVPGLPPAAERSLELDTYAALRLTYER